MPHSLAVGEKSHPKQRIQRRRFSSPFSEPRTGTSWIPVAVYLLNATISQTIEQRLPTRPALEVSFHLTRWLLYLPMRNRISQIALSGDLLAVVSGWIQARKLVQRRLGTLARITT